MRYSRRTDTGSKALTQVARKLGFTVIPCDGTIDAIFVRHGQITLVDFKASAKAKKTARQAALDAAGVPIAYIHSIEQLLAMVNR